MNNSAPAQPGVKPVMELIQQLRSGTLAGSSLTIDDRRACVEYLTAEGYSVAEVAGILKVADRTVLRDRKAVREANSVERDESLITEMVGHLLREADIAANRLRRVARDKSTPAHGKVDAERFAWLVTKDLIVLLQRLGYLPEAAREFRADLTHRITDEPAEYGELAEELERLESIQRTTGAGSAGVITGLLEARQTLLKLSAGQKLREIAATVTAAVAGNDEQREQEPTDGHSEESEE
ncbi:MAG: hypothetical protein K1X67_17120 [Fimbriimonadaceae bacterium]|nr:hypothetical protein [Fimbriimonadaceae bacterium]